MFNSTVLEVAIGMSFCFASVSLLASAINEAIASLLRLRARALLGGIKQLLNDPAFEGLARELYNHALVNPRDAGQARSERDLRHLPSYIPSRGFALALIETLQGASGEAAALRARLDTVSDPQLKRLLLGMYQRAAGDIASLQQAIADWFDAGMERVSGAYKRRTQAISFGVALLVAALFNIDALQLFRSLWVHPALVAALPLADTPTRMSDAIQALNQLPIGWQSVPGTLTAWALTICGWLVTASSALFGAPFWFDLLQRLTRLRGTGRAQESAPAVAGGGAAR